MNLDRPEHKRDKVTQLLALHLAAALDLNQRPLGMGSTTGA